MSRKRRRNSGHPARVAGSQSPSTSSGRGSGGSGRGGGGSGRGALGYELEQLPPAGVSFPQVLRTTDFVWWRSVLGIVVALSLYFLLTSVVSQVLIMASWLITRPAEAYAVYFGRAQAFEVPGGMLAANLGIATLIPITFVVIMIVHRVRPRWLGSVRPGLRWKYLFICLGIAAVALAAVFALSTLVGPDVSIEPQQSYWIFLIIILLTSPLQAAGEEYLFRGYLLQAVGSVVRQPWFGVVVSSLIFALFHGTQNLPLFFDRLAFGLLAAILVYRTGGIEAPIAAHVINNLYAFGIAGLTGTIAQARALQQIGWVDAAFDVGGFALCAVLAWLAARLLKLRTITATA